MQRSRMIVTGVFVSLLVLSISAQTPPPQPTDGPGGKNYSHGSMVMTRYGTVLEDTYWKFEPADPAPDSAHVIIHFHGHATQATLEEFCGEKTGEWFWIKHLVRKGYVVMDSAATSIGGDIPVTAKTVSGVAILAGRSGIRIESSACALRDIAVFDTRGRLVAHYDNIFAKHATIAGLERYRAVCLRILLTNNTVIVRKIIGGR